MNEDSKHRAYLVFLFLSMMSNEERLEIFNHYCKQCGKSREDNPCQCWNFEIFDVKYHE